MPKIPIFSDFGNRMLNIQKKSNVTGISKNVDFTNNRHEYVKAFDMSACSIA